MSRVTPDERTLAILAGIRDQAEICDSDGRVIGYFQPVCKETPELRYEPKVSKEELDRFEQEPGARTLSEIISDWKKRRSNAAECPFTEDELDGFENEPGPRRTLAEIMSHSIR